MPLSAFLSETGGLRAVFQPIVDLATGRPVAYEALSRFGSREAPASVFERARLLGLGEELETHAAATALAEPAPLPDGCRLSINMSPSTLLSPRGRGVLPADLRGLVIEITENELVVGDEELIACLAGLRKAGARIAVDDAGAGYAGLQQVTHVRPDIIKLDRSLITSVQYDPAKQALIEAFVGFGRRIGATVCAEGIERLDELGMLAALDVATGQGFLLAHPGEPWPTVDPAAVAVCIDGMEAALRRSSSLGRDHTEATYEAVARRLAACRTLRDLDRCVDVMHRLLDVPELSVSRIVEHEDEPALLSCAGPRWGQEPPYRLTDYPATWQALQRGQALQVLASDPEADPSEVELLQQHGYGALLLIPLIVHDRPIGTLEAFARVERPWTRRQIMLARAVAHQLATVVSLLAAPGQPMPDGELLG